LIISESEFLEKCAKGLCARNTIKSGNCSRATKRTRCYQRYLKLQEKKSWKDNVDENWEAVRQRVVDRDKGKCRLCECLSLEEWSVAQEVLKNSYPNNLDCAHVLGKGAHPKLKYVDRNVVSLYRVFHNRLDECKHPLTGKPMDRTVIDFWWKRIIGKAEFEELQEMNNLEVEDG